MLIANSSKMTKDMPLKFDTHAPGTVLTWPWKSFRKLVVASVTRYINLGVLN